MAGITVDLNFTPILALQLSLKTFKSVKHGKVTKFLFLKITTLTVKNLWNWTPQVVDSALAHPLLKCCLCLWRHV